MKSYLMEAGHAKQLSFWVNRSFHIKKIRFPASVVLMLHPEQGPVLFDTGYSEEFKRQTKYFPEKLYALAVPMEIAEGDSVASKLHKIGLKATDIRHVIISHFHGDHVGGLKDFPKANFHFANSGLQHLLSLSRIGQVRAGFLKGLLPSDFMQRARPFSTERLRVISPWGLVLDLFGDESILIKALEGHCEGQVGLIAQLSLSGSLGEKPYLFAADAFWDPQALQHPERLSPITKLLQKDAAVYTRTLLDLNRLQKDHPELSILGCHCEQSYREQKALGAEFL